MSERLRYFANHVKSDITRQILHEEGYRLVQCLTCGFVRLLRDGKTCSHIDREDDPHVLRDKMRAGQHSRKKAS